MEPVLERVLLRLAAVLVVTASMLRLAAAASGTEPIRLSFNAPGDCPSEAEFFAEVAARTHRVRPATEHEPARRFEVTVSAEHGRYRAELRVANLDGSATVRDVSGSTCGEVVTAVALITAVTVDPDASTSRLPKGTEPDSSASLSVPETGSIRPSARAEPPAPAAATPPLVQERGVVPDLASSIGGGSPSSSMRARWTVGVAGQALLGIVPDSAAGGGAFIERGRNLPVPWSATFRASVFVSIADTTFAGNVGADLLWALLRLEACPLHLRVVDELGLHLCALMDAGTLRIRGRGLDNPNAELRAWFAPGALGRLQWEIAERLVVELGAGVLVPARRYPFRYLPAGQSQPVDAYQIPVVGTALTLGAGYRFQ